MLLQLSPTYYSLPSTFASNLLTDFLLTPVVLFLSICILWILRKKLADSTIKKYFLPAFAVKVIGAISLGLLYHFYYGYGDTLRYHWYATFISEELWANPSKGLRFLFVDLDNIPQDLWYILRKVKFTTEDGTFLIVRITAVLSFFCYQSYYAVAVLYAMLSFSGSWLLFKAFYRLYPALHKQFALAILFVPSIFFWGSGIMKDSITLSALGWLFYAVVFFNERKIWNTIIIIISSWLLIAIKLYIFLIFAIAGIIWFAAKFHHKLSHPLIRLIVMPIVMFMVITGMYFVVNELGKINARFALENVANSAEVMAQTQLELSEQDQGSAYQLGSDPLDYSITGVLKKLPLAINVTFFRPYVWEVRNPVMVMAALESLVILIFTLRVLWRKRIIGVFKFKEHTIIVFCFAFAVIFAASIGMTSYNFGTLVRYKIPCIPFFLAGLIILNQIDTSKYKRVLRKKRRFELQVN